MTHLIFMERLVRDLVLSHEENTEIRGVPSSSETQMSRLHWTGRPKEKVDGCYVPNEERKQKIVYCCKKYD
jgi:hypothetical protein